MVIHGLGDEPRKLHGCLVDRFGAAQNVDSLLLGGLDQLLRQVGEVIRAQAAKEESPLDDTVALDRAVPLLFRMVEGLLLADQCDRIVEGVNRLNVPADHLLQAFKLSADLLCVGALARFNN